jgi:hypothetical protein
MCSRWQPQTAKSPSVESLDSLSNPTTEICQQPAKHDFEMISTDEAMKSDKSTEQQ